MDGERRWLLVMKLTTTRCKKPGDKQQEIDRNDYSVHDESNLKMLKYIYLTEKITVYIREIMSLKFRWIDRKSVV